MPKPQVSGIFRTEAYFYCLIIFLVNSSNNLHSLKNITIEVIYQSL
jgi:hypothetical protein